ncbi:adenosylcobinamide-phosphate synthase CbiB [Calidifontibacter terrae]
MIAVGLVAGFVADRRWGDPRRFHPVAGFGSVATASQKICYAPTRTHGIFHEATLVGAVLLGAARLPKSSLITAAATWAVLGGRSLDREADAIYRQLATADLPAARQQVRNLVGRDPETLDLDGVARATVESVAENCSDAVVAPLFWGAVAGAPGLITYRAINTLDAMVGHRTPRYEQFGWAAAKLDDLANWAPARLAALCVIAAEPRQAQAIVSAIRRDAPHHPSPNGGVIEAAFAAALGVQLGGTNVYQGRAENRGTLGSGRPVTAADIPATVALHRRVSVLSLGAAVILRIVRS